MDVALTLVLVGIGAAATVAMVVAWHGLHARLRSKGYGRLFAIVTISLPALACYIAGFALLGEVSENPSTAEWLQRTFLAVYAPPLCWFALTASFVWVLPRRQRRRFGRRRPRVPFVWIGRLTIGFGVLMFVNFLILLLTGGADSGKWGIASIGVIGFGQYWVSVGRRIKEAPDTIGEQEGFVLYLRAFTAERQGFVTGPKSVYGRYSQGLQALTSRRGTRITLTFEDFLGEEFTTRIGPFVALGNPLDFVPPEGAVREYARDSGWRERFLDLATRARCIAVETGSSANLDWELETIRQQGMSGKLYFFTPPADPKANGRIRRTWRALLAWSAGRERPSWSQLGAAVRKAGYLFDVPDPGSGAVLTFDTQENPMLITTDAQHPQDYVAPMADWMTNGSRTGKVVPDRCASCSTSIFRHAVSPTGLCDACERAEKRRNMSTVERAMEHPVVSGAYALVCLVLLGLLSPPSWTLLPALFALLLLPFVVESAWGKVRSRYASERSAASRSSRQPRPEAVAAAVTAPLDRPDDSAGG